MIVCIANTLCLIGSAIASYCALYYGHGHSDPSTGVLPHLVLLPMVLYVGFRRSVAGYVNYMAFAVVLAVSVCFPVAIVMQGTPQQMAGAFIAVAAYVAIFVIMPILCCLKSNAARRGRDHCRGFPVVQIVPDNQSGKRS